MSWEPTAIVGIGQTHHKSRRRDVSFPGLIREAAVRALEDAQMTWGDIDAVVLGKAPDLFEGVMKPELYMSDALGATGKPMFRVHTAGSVGGTTGIVASHHVQAGVHKRVMAVAFEKQSEGNAQFALGSGRGASLGAGGAFAPFIRSYIAPQRRARAHRVAGRGEGPAERAEERVRAPQDRGHLDREGARVADDVGADRYLESCPSSDGACAVIFTDEDGGKAAASDGRQPAWVLGTAVRSEPGQLPRARRRCGRRARSTARGTSTGRSASPTRASRSTWPSCTCRSAGTSRSGSRVTTSPPVGEGWKMVDSGETEISGSFPVNCSGGVLSSNPIGASGLLRFAEAALQVRGMAGEHQVDGANVALGQAYGANMQYFAMWIVANSLDPFAN